MEEKKEEHKEHHEHTHHEHHAHHKKNASKKLNLENVFIGLTILLGIVVIINIAITVGLNKDIKKSSDEAKEKLKPANIQLYIIKNSKCADCFDVSVLQSYMKTLNVNITKESTLDFSAKEAKDLITKYQIKKVPAVIVAGEIEKVNVEGMEKVNDALVLADIGAPYTDATTGKIEGRVTLSILKDADCAKCNDLKNLISQLKAAGIKISQEKNVLSNTDEGKNLINKYNIGFIPTLILSKDATAYPIIQEAWPQVGSKETDGSYVLRLVNPPYINLTTGKLRGLVSVVYMADKSCTECYNVSVHREILASPQSFAVKLEKEETIDIDSAKGKDLIVKYNITQVPTVILSDEISAYPSTPALKQFFSVEKDGYYVFRKDSVVGNYRDLTTNQIVTIPTQPQ